MKVLVTGGSGQLAYDVIQKLISSGVDYLAIDFQDADITDQDAVSKIVENYNPNIIIHCAAYTAVDRSEEEKEKSYLVNVVGTRNVARAALKSNSKLIYISTDYVFDGSGNNDFQVHDVPNPVNWYGVTKFMGEIEVRNILSKYFIVRISWVFGQNGNNFVKTMLNLAKKSKSISVVEDQIGSPTFCEDLAPLLIEMSQTEKYGIYHATNEGYCSWKEFAEAIFQFSGIECEVNGIATSEYTTRAERPLNSRMSKSSLVEHGFNKLPGWKDALERMIKKINVE